MAWSDQQQYPVPQNMPQGMPGEPAPINSLPPSPNGYQGQASNPLQPSAQVAGPYPTAANNPIMQAAQPPVPAAVAPNVGQPAAGIPQQVSNRPMDDDKMNLDDVEWVNRAKRVIAGTQGDPHRQVQLIQHLRSQYLKQRFGRTVHTDEA